MTRTLSAVLIAALLAGVTGCDLSGLGIGDPPITERVLSAPELGSAMLRTRDIGTGLKLSPDGKSDPGCLINPSTMRKRIPGGVAVTRQASRNWAPRHADPDLGPNLGVEVWSVRSTEDATRAMAAASRIWRDCRSVTVGSGTNRTTMRLASSTAPAGPEVDEQLNLAAVTQLRIPGARSLQVGLWVAVVRIENQMLFLSYSSFGNGGTITGLTSAALTRLIPVLRGQEPAIPVPLGLTPTSVDRVVRELLR